MKKAIFILAAFFLMATSAEGRQHHHQRHHHISKRTIAPACFFCGKWNAAPAIRVQHRHTYTRYARVNHRHRQHYAAVESNLRKISTTYLSHPSGCPSRAFCGCGAMRHLGLNDRSLWLAASWYKFPRAAPAPSTVAVRPHHVFVLQSHVSGNMWLVADYNSGGHQSRLHVRSISGYTIVNPHS